MSAAAARAAGRDIALGADGAEGFARRLAAYGRALQAAHGGWSSVPTEAFGVRIAARDAFADRASALRLLALMAKPPFFIRSLRTDVASLCRTREGPDPELMDALRPEAFAPKTGADAHAPEPALRIESGSFCDAELERRRGSCRFARIEAVARELARRGLSQEHRILVASREASLGNLLENLYRAVRLGELCGGGFSAAATPSPKDAADPLVRACLARMRKAPPPAWLAEFERVLLDALLEAETLRLARRRPARAAALRSAVERFRDYQELRPL